MHRRATGPHAATLLRAAIWLGLLVTACGFVLRLGTVVGLLDVTRDKADTVVIAGSVVALCGLFLLVGRLAGARTD